MRRKLVIKVILVLSVLVCALGLFACSEKNDGGAFGSNIGGTYYHYADGVWDKSDYVTINGEKWTSSSGDYGKLKTSGSSIIFYIDLFGESVEYTSGTVSGGVLKIRRTGKWEYYCMEGKVPSDMGNEPPIVTASVTVTYNANGGIFADDKTVFTQAADTDTVLTAPQSPSRKNYHFSGWATSSDGKKLWNFATDVVSKDITLYAVWEQQSAVIFSVDGASIDDNAMSVFLLVEHEIDNVSLSNKVVCSNDSIWKLYYDRLGQTEIPTKIAAGRTGELSNGDNVFYIVVTSANGTQVNTYTLTVHRSYLVNINFYDNKNHIIKQDDVYTGYEYNVDYIPTIDGYVFNYWKNAYDNETTKITPYGKVDLYADCTARKYDVFLDTNGGNEVSKTEYEVTYDESYSFNVPTRSGYSFLGWYDGNTQVTNSSGRSIADWTYTNSKTLKAKWQANSYRVSLYTSDSKAGTVSGDGNYDYDSSVTVTAKTNSGYTWLGWYDSNNEIVTMDLSYSFKMGFSTSYTAKWTSYTLTTTRNDNNAGTITTKNAVKTTAGQSVTITAYTNSGYTWLGWYNGEIELTNNQNYTFYMPAENITYTAKWTYYTLTTNTNDSSAGSYTQKTAVKTTAGQSVTVTATTNSGYTWVGWYNGETELTNELSYTFAMPSSNVTYTAKWIACPVTLEKSVAQAGSVSMPSTSIIGKNTTITATTNSGYTWVGWYNGETKLTNELSYTFAMPSSNVTCTAKWIKVTVDRSNTSAGTVTSLTGTYKVGDSVTVTATTNSGYTWVGWYNGETELTDELSYTFDMPSSNVTYTAKWIKVTVDRSNTSAGTVTSLTGTYKVGDSATVTATTNSGYTWVGWYNGTTKLTDELSYTFDMPSENWTYIAKWIVKDELKNFTFISTPTTLEITGVNNPNVSELIIPDYVTSISKGAFADCRFLESITLPFIGASIEATRSEALFGFIFGDRKYIGGLATAQHYDHTSSAFSITYYIPASLRSVTILGGEIREGAFYSCRRIQHIVISDNVTSIGRNAFHSCQELMDIIIPQSVKKIDYYAFTGCIKLAIYCEIDSQPLGWIRDYWNNLDRPVIWNYPTNNKDEDGYGYSVIDGIRYSLKDNIATVAWQPDNICGAIIIPSSVNFMGANYSVTSIGRNAFFNCSSLTSIEIPSSVTSIGEYAFSGCSSLTSITIPFVGASKDGTSNTHFGYIFGASGPSYNSSYVPSSLKTVIITGGTIIAFEAFYDCSSLTSITIPNSVTSINGHAFVRCSGLTSITIPNSVTGIGYDAFFGCTSLTIYCEAASEPSGWASDWNSSNRPVVWDYKNK